MTLSRFPTLMPQAADAVINLAVALRYIRDTSGDLQFRHIDNVQQNMRIAKEVCIAALTEGSKAPAGAEAFMANMGGPLTLADFQAGLMNIEAKSAAWNALLTSWVAGLSGSDCLTVATISRNGIDTKALQRVEFVDDNRAAPLRTSTELADLIAALEAVGA